MSVLIHIGYPKSGTTFLQDWFRAHPAVLFQSDFLNPYSQTGVIPARPKPHLRGKQHFVISEEQLVLWQGKLNIVGIQFTPFDIKAQQRATARALCQFYPEAKVLIVTRGFESLLKSMYAQYLSIGGVLGFENYMDRIGEHLAEFYDYSYVIELYREIFKPKNVLVLPFELLKQNSAAFMSELSMASGIDANSNYPLNKVNASAAPRLLSAYHLLSQLLYTMIWPLPPSWQLKIYTRYMAGLTQGKLKGIAGLLSPLVAETDIAVSEQVLSLFKGNAEILKQEKLFHPYQKEYLI